MQMNTKQDSAEALYIDRILRDYFHAQAPRTWLAPTVSARATSDTRLGKRVTRGRMALAASLALLVGGQFLIHRQIQSERPIGSTRPAVDVASPAHKKPRTTSPAVGTEFSKPTKPEMK